MVQRLQPRWVFSYVVLATFLFCLLLGTPTATYASYSEARALYDWGVNVGPRVLADEDSPLESGAKVSGYVVELEGVAYLAQPGEGLRKIALPADVLIDDIKGKYVAAEVAGTQGDVATLGVAVPAPAPVAPADQSATDSPVSNETPPELGEAGIKPDRRFLNFFDRTGEGIGHFVRFGAASRARYDSQVAAERLAEAKELLEAKDFVAAQRATNQYKDAVDNVEGSIDGVGEDNPEIEEIRKTMAAHAAILSSDLASSAPEELRQTFEDVTQSTGRALAVIADKRGEAPLTPETIERIQSAVALGALPPNAAAAIFGAKNRAEALDVMEGQVKNGLLPGPDADYLRFDAVRTQYRDSFDKAHEISKLNYIRKSEDEIKKINDDPVLKKQIEEFGRNFKEGQQPPEALRRAWAQSVNVEAAQFTLRPEKLDASQIKDENFRQYYQNVSGQLKPSQGEAEDLARAQSEFPRLLPQFQRVIQQVAPGVREEAPGQPSREGFSGCKNADECVAKAKEFQQQYSSPEERRNFFQQEFRRVDQQNRLPGQPGQNPPNGAPTSEFNNLSGQLRAGARPAPGSPENAQGVPRFLQDESGRQIQNPEYRPSGNEPRNDFYSKDYPRPRDINSGPSALLRQSGSEPLKPGESRQYPGAPNGPSDANRPPGQYQPPAGSSGGSSSGSYNPPPPPSSGGSEPSGGGAPPPPPSGGDSGGGGGDSGGGAPPPPSDGGGGGGDSGGGAPPPPPGP